MKCPICGSTGLKTTNSRSTKMGAQTWRRKECRKCHSSITTYEKPDLGWLNIKYPTQNKSYKYNRGLLTKSILLSFDDDELRDINIENVIDNVEQKIVSIHKTMLPKNELVKIVLNTLQPISTNATIKYLANYGQQNNNAKLNKLIKSLQ
jgi:transcriptional regulator NrdR family protein